MERYLIDTNILIEQFKGNQKAINFLNQNENCFLSYVTIGEILQGAKNKKELVLIEDLVNIFEKNYGSSSISQMSINLLKQYHLSQGIGLFDSILAATSLVTNTTLVTLNTKHFKFIENLKFTTI